MDKNTSLEDWLSYIEQAHVKDIDMGLSRTAEMINRLDIDFSGQHVITVGGTNGKGTTCALIEQICLQAGLSVGVYSSPHLVSFCERIRIDGEQIRPSALCATFSCIDEKRKGERNAADNSNEIIALTYFEFATLAALKTFSEQKLDIVVLEVGLGGRLDATNVIDADISVITSIGLDHQDWLGDTKEKIGFEKAGIFRTNRPAVIGEPDAPLSMLNHAKAIDAALIQVGRDFIFSEANNSVEVANTEFDVRCAQIPKPNVATALAAVVELGKLLKAKNKFLVPEQDVQACIDKTQVMGRHTRWDANTVSFESQRGSLLNPCDILLDVAHNEDSAAQLREIIRTYSFAHCHIVVGMLKDKNIEVSLAAFDDVPANWYCASLPTARGEKAIRLQHTVESFVKEQGAACSINEIASFEITEDAFYAALKKARKSDLIVVLGSFLTVAAVIELQASA